MYNFQKLLSDNYSIEKAAEVMTALLLGLVPEKAPEPVEEETEEHFQRILRPLSTPESVMELDIDEVCGYRECECYSPKEMWVPCQVCSGKGKIKKLIEVPEKDKIYHREIVEVCAECKGKRGLWDDNSTVDAYFTTSGDTPVTVDEPTALAMSTPRNFHELAPRKSFYSEAKFNPHFQGMHPTNEEGAVLKAILDADKIEDYDEKMLRYRVIWKGFWNKFWAYQECAQWYLTPRAVKRIRLALESRMDKNAR